jgi:hypothetical protein
MSPDPAAAPTDPVLATLYEVQIHFATFRQLTGVDDPMELTLDRLRRTRERLAREHHAVRTKHRGEDITCLAWTVGVFWLLPDGVSEYVKAIEKSNAEKEGPGIHPVWRLTVREILDSHIANLRQLVLWVAYDLMTIDALKQKLPRDHVTLKTEFARCERVVVDLIQELSQERERFSKVLSDEVELYERAIMTERMIEAGDVTEGELGYTVETLRAAQKRIEDLCRRELAVYEQVLTMTRGRIQEGLRGGERAQLARTSRWDVAMHRFEEPPEGFMGLASLVSFERRRLAAIVATREEELGPSDEGEALLEESKALDEAEKKPPAPPPEEEVVAEPEKPPKPAKKKLVRRMATIDRRGQT